MKIVYCIPSLCPSGGMERVLTVKANYFADVLNDDISIVVTEGKDKSPFYHLSSKIRVIQLDINFEEVYRHVHFLRKYYLYLKKQRLYRKRLSKCLFDLKADIVISTMRREINFINDIKDGSKKIGEVHFARIGYRELHIKYMPDKLNRFLSAYWFNMLLKKIKELSAFVVLTNADVDNWPHLDHVYVIHNPISFVSEQTADMESKKIIVVGRYDPLKGYDYLLEAWKIVNTQHSDWTIEIYGDGDNLSLQQKAEHLKLYNFICNKPKENILPKYLESSIFVLSSLREGFSLALVEAMNCGLACVAFDSTGPKEIINDGVDGLLVENKNSLLLAEKINYLIENEEFRVLLGKQAKISVERFNINKIGEQWHSLFNSVLV